MDSQGKAALLPVPFCNLGIVSLFLSYLFKGLFYLFIIYLTKEKDYNAKSNKATIAYSEQETYEF